MSLETRVVKRIRAGERSVNLQAQARCPECEAWTDANGEQVVSETPLACDGCGWHGYADGRDAA